jgi:hypothetical protein
MNCRLVLICRSQFFQSRWHFSSQAKERSTTQRFGITAKVGNSLHRATCTLGVYWKYTVGDYRIIARIEGGALCILVVRIRNQREVYRKT